jgi:hypothetical protein
LLADAARPRRYTRQQYLRTPEEMTALFADLPEALENSVQIARRCSLLLQLGESRLPAYPVPTGQSTEEFLRSEASRGLETRLAKLVGADPAVYGARLQSELEVICNMGFAGYFLIVADFIRWARENGVPVGPGRGSGAGSLVAYSLGITDIDPLQYDLLFERFLNPERVSMPDFDVDFCMDGRDRVIEYVADGDLVLAVFLVAGDIVGDRVVDAEHTAFSEFVDHEGGDRLRRGVDAERGVDGRAHPFGVPAVVRAVAAGVPEGSVEDHRTVASNTHLHGRMDSAAVPGPYRPPHCLDLAGADPARLG